MEKHATEALSGDEMAEWSFPAVDLRVTPPGKVEEDPSIIATRDALAVKTREVESLKNEYMQKMALLSDILNKLENPIAIMDEELIETLQHIIKTTVKKIIYKEMSADPDTVKRIMTELSQLVQENNGMLTIFLAEADYSRLAESEAKPNVLIKIKPELSAGDVIIKTNTAEIRAVLEDRIDQVLGIKNA